MTTLVLPREETRAGRSLLRGLVSYWPLAFPTGGVVDLRDLKGGNVLTDNNTVTTAAGPSSKLARATHFTAALLETLGRDDNASLSLGPGVQFTIVIWVYADTLVDDPHIVAKFSYGDNQREYRIFWQLPRFQMNVSSNGITETNVAANVLGAPNTASWYCIEAGYDGSNIFIAGNAGPRDITSFTADILDGTSDLVIGALRIGERFWDGRLCALGLWKRALSRKETAYLYNGGQGRSFRKNRGFY